MAEIWNAPQTIIELVSKVKAAHHPHLVNANVWAICTDAKHVSDNKVLYTKSSKATKTEKLEGDHDFKIIVYTSSWAHLTDKQREVVIDEALSRCGVKYVPQKIEINGRKEVVKDEMGRTVFTDEIEYDSNGIPKWKIIKPDASIYFNLIKRHGMYSEDLDNTARTIEGKPIKGVDVVTESKDLVEGEEEESSYKELPPLNPNFQPFGTMDSCSEYEDGFMKYKPLG